MFKKPKPVISQNDIETLCVSYYWFEVVGGTEEVLTVQSCEVWGIPRDEMIGDCVCVCVSLSLPLSLSLSLSFSFSFSVSLSLSLSIDLCLLSLCYQKIEDIWKIEWVGGAALSSPPFAHLVVSMFIFPNMFPMGSREEQSKCGQNAFL